MSKQAHIWNRLVSCDEKQSQLLPQVLHGWLLASKIVYDARSEDGRLHEILVTTGVFRIRKGKRFPWRFSTLFPQFFLNFSTRSEAECGNFEEILWKLSGKSEWKSFPLEYPENGSWLQIYLLSSIFGVFPPSLSTPPNKGLWEGSHPLLSPRPLYNLPRPQAF